MERSVKKRQTGNTLLTIGALLFVFGWILVLLCRRIYAPDIISGRLYSEPT
jgi:hypothetical protein